MMEHQCFVSISPVQFLPVGIEFGWNKYENKQEMEIMGCY